MNIAWPYYFTNTPLSQNVKAGDIFTIYKINQDPNNLIYQGVVAQGVRRLLLNSIFQQFVQPYNYDLNFENFEYPMAATIFPQTFYLNVNGQSTTTYNVWWNYADYKKGTDLGGNSGNLLDIGFGNVQDYYSPNLPVLIYAYAKLLSVSQDTTTLFHSDYNQKDSACILYYIGKDDPYLNPSRNIKLGIQHFDNTIVEDFTLHPLPCSEGYTHCLYFLKRDGSIGWVFCKGRTGEKINAERAQITIADTTTNLNPTIENYQVQHYRSWKFNTGFLTQQQARKLSDLFVSPRVWLFDIDSNMIGNVIVTDKSFEIKDKRVSEAPISYTINVREAQTNSILIP